MLVLILFGEAFGEDGQGALAGAVGRQSGKLDAASDAAHTTDIDDMGMRISHVWQ